MISSWIPFLLFLLFGLRSCTDCPSLDLPPCCHVDPFEIHCPVEDNDIVIHIKDQIEINCPRDLEKLTITQLPNLKTQKTKILKLKSCPWPQQPFKKILDHLLNEVTELEFVSSKRTTIYSDDFQGLKKLELLNLNDNGIRNLDGKVFLNTPNLLVLELAYNNLTLKDDLFKNVPLLRHLDVSNNNLETVQDVFQNLKKLQVLHLWNNKLAKLDSSTFRGLGDLKSLELSANRIQTIAKDAFKELKRLESINLSMNKIRKVPQNLFKYNKKLKVVKIHKNFHLKLPDYLFANSVITEVELMNCHLETIPEHIFENSSSLQIIKLSKNKLKYLPDVLFKDLGNLTKIRLQDNQIESVSKAFKGLKRLKLLDLQNNFISILASEVFADLINVETILLKGNSISHIDGNLFSNKPYLADLNLSHNTIITAFDEIISLESASSLTTLDLSHNNISSVKLGQFKPVRKIFVKLDYNNVTFVDFENFDLSISLTISLKNNLLVCDCRNYDLFEYLNKNKNSIIIEKKKCPIIIKNQNISEIIQSELLTCSLEEMSKNYTDCPEHCSCSWRPFDKSIVIDCSYRNLTEFPKIDLKQVDFVRFNQTVINLEGNDFTSGPENFTGYDNVTKLFLSHNRIRTITWLPPKLEVLLLDYNQVTNLEKNVVKKLNTTRLVKLVLHHNPWLCNCDSKALAGFLHHSSIVDKTDVSCVNTHRLLINFKAADLCHQWETIYLIMIVLLLLLVLSISFAIYYRYQQTIKIQLFAKNLCLCWVTEEELDKDKTYDAFISYSHKDEDFVVNNLIPVLEKGPHPYKLCLHYRNWVPGEFISAQITNSVLESRRTLVVLSRNFLESIWGKMEFRTAHTQAMSEGRARVIIVLYGDIDVDDLDEELKMYLKTNTYVKWEDPYFWNKLKYALPHHKRVVTKRGHRVANMVNWNEDSRLIHSVPSTPGDTPSVSLSPSLSKISPLSFERREEMLCV